MKRLILFAIAALAMFSCGKKDKADDPLAESGRTQRTENLLSNLKKLSAEGYLVGHQDGTVYGIGWVGDSCRSDVQSVCGDFPAVLGFDLGHLELGDSLNLDGVPFDRMRQEIIRQYERGGMVTLSWHLDNPLTGGTAWVVGDSLAEQEKLTVASVLEGGEKHEVFLGWLDTLASFLNSLETPYGVRVPVLFRPWHEHTGSWFWWGQNLCTTEQYKALWQLTIDRLKQQGVVNTLYAYSPGTEFAGDAEKFLERWPGDGLVDVIGFDSYCTNNPEDTTGINNYKTSLDANLKTLCEIAKQHNVVPALTETGMESLGKADWWTETLMPVLNKYPIAYVLLWRNAHDKEGHFYMPYPGQQTVSDFVKFYNDKRTLFVKDVNALYM